MIKLYKKIALIGPPASGKTTQAERIEQKFNLPRLTTGQILRQNKNQKTEYGKPRNYIEKGKLVPDPLIVQIVKQHLSQPEFSEGFVLDGYPRTIKQAEALHDFKPLDIVLMLQLEDAKIQERASERMYCPECGETYHLRLKPPKRYGICDRCGSKLKAREDNSRTALKGQIKEYRNKTKKLVDFYEAYSKLEKIDANGTIENTWNQVKTRIKRDGDNV
ncbi:MAG: nucleoside monophosphate kinase [Candidatus Nanohaloarchaeota archaeon QJJ-9]|nr:nucleoside monophosphate kinase [Candidatus Nanohaloarchaeota archaeon QJJ-9]